MYLLWSPTVLPGEPLVLSCTLMLLIGRTNKSHEVFPSNCKRWVISTPVWLLEPTCVTRAYMINSRLHVGWVYWSERMNINRGVALLIWTHTLSHLCSALVEKRSSWRRRIRIWSPCWFYLLSFWGFYIEEAFAGFFPLGFSQNKSSCSFCMIVLVYLLVILFICFCYENEMKYWIWKFNMVWEPP